MTRFPPNEGRSGPVTERRVAIAIHEGVQALDVAGPIDVFSEANGFLGSSGRYETSLLARSREPVTASSGMRVLPDFVFGEERARFDISLVAGGPALPDAEPDSQLSDWLRGAAEGEGLYGSICTGAFALGHAGLLDDRAVTTHWQNAAQLARRFPRARVEHDRIHLRDGRLITSAGVTAGIDLALALVCDDHGAELARAVAKRLVVVAQRQGGQSQFSPLLATPATPDSPLARAQRHVLEHLAEPLNVERLAQAAGTSDRNLARLFVKEAGVTPHEFVEAVRVDAARSLLEGTMLPFKSIAYDCGFGSAERMRSAFARRLGISPAQYRASFQSAF
jgi:transcriptional regulator GlxA family with amidase domain